MVRRINKNAYELDLPPSYNMSHTFNVGDLSPFDVGFINSLLNSHYGGEDDKSMTHYESLKDLPRRITKSMTRRNASNPLSLSLFFISLC